MIELKLFIFVALFLILFYFTTFIPKLIDSINEIKKDRKRRKKEKEEWEKL
jgi:hypothetical protein